VCENCQTPYTGREPGTKCEKCGVGKLVRRKDDEPAAIRNRLKVYEAQTAPVFNWYKLNGTKVVNVNAVGDIADVTTRALKALGRDGRGR
jgi:adenylate kinase